MKWQEKHKLQKKSYYKKQKPGERGGSRLYNRVLGTAWLRTNLLSKQGKIYAARAAIPIAPAASNLSASNKIFK